METTNEEKAIDTLWELLPAPTQTQSPAKATLVPEITHPYINIAAPHTATLITPAIPQQPNLRQPHIITQDDTELENTPPQQHQCNLQSRAHLIADSVVPLCVPALHLHLTNVITHQPQLKQHSIALTYNMCIAIIAETMGTPLEYRQLIKQDKDIFCK